MSTAEEQQEKMREQLSELATKSYKQGFKDGQMAVAEVFENLDAKNDEANNLYKEIANVIRKLQILDDKESE